MNHVLILDLVGGVAIIMAACTSIHVFADEWWDYYGRQTLIAWIALGFAVGTLRLLRTAEVIGQDTQAFINSIIFIATAAHVMEASVLQTLVGRRRP